jgi:hypothetical protein
MSRSKTTVEVQTIPAPTGVTTCASIIDALWERASGNLSTEEIKWLSNAGEQADVMTASLMDVVNGIAGLVAADEQSGDFQRKDDVSQLLWFIGGSLSDINAMHDIGRRANFLLKTAGKGGTS